MSDTRLELDKKEPVLGAADEELAKNAALGDERSFTELVERYSSKIFSLAYRFLNNAVDAEDVVQEVFIKVYRALPKSKLDLPFKPWIYRIAMNECINRSKKRREVVMETDVLLREVSAPGLTPVDEIVRKELKEALEKAVNALPERYRPVVILRYAEGLSFREIGEVLAIPEGTAKTYFFRAKEILKEALSGFEI